MGIVSWIKIQMSCTFLRILIFKHLHRCSQCSYPNDTLLLPNDKMAAAHKCLPRNSLTVQNRKCIRRKRTMARFIAHAAALREKYSSREMGTTRLFSAKHDAIDGSDKEEDTVRRWRLSEFASRETRAGISRRWTSVRPFAMLAKRIS